MQSQYTGDELIVSPVMIYLDFSTPPRSSSRFRLHPVFVLPYKTAEPLELLIFLSTTESIIFLVLSIVSYGFLRVLCNRVIGGQNVVSSAKLNKKFKIKKTWKLLGGKNVGSFAKLNIKNKCKKKTSPNHFFFFSVVVVFYFLHSSKLMAFFFLLRFVFHARKKRTPCFDFGPKSYIPP